jgi:hypothetical protein
MVMDELVDCARCFAPAVEVVTVVAGGRELELDLCADHVEGLLAGASSLTYAEPPPVSSTRQISRHHRRRSMSGVKPIDLQ